MLIYPSPQLPAIKAVNKMGNIKKVFLVALLAVTALTGCRIEKSEARSVKVSPVQQAPEEKFAAPYNKEKSDEAIKKAKEVKRDLDDQIKEAEAAASAASAATHEPPTSKDGKKEVWQEVRRKKKSPEEEEIEWLRKTLRSEG